MVSVLLIAILAVVAFVFAKRRGLLRSKDGSSVPHQRFSDEVFVGSGPDGSIAMHNQMFDLDSSDASDPSDPSKFMAAEGEITLGNEKAVYRNGSGSAGPGERREETDNGFSNPLYSAMQPRESSVLPVSGHASAGGDGDLSRG